jgi:hypothetical protein
MQIMQEQLSVTKSRNPNNFSGPENVGVRTSPQPTKLDTRLRGYDAYVGQALLIQATACRFDFSRTLFLHQGLPEFEQKAFG